MPGLDYLRTLLHNPGRDLGVSDLSSGDGSADPRRRIMVRQAIATAMSRLDMVDPELAEELRATDPHRAHLPLRPRPAPADGVAPRGRRRARHPRALTHPLSQRGARA